MLLSRDIASMHPECRFVGYIRPDPAKGGASVLYYAQRCALLRCMLSRTSEAPSAYRHNAVADRSGCYLGKAGTKPSGPDSGEQAGGLARAPTGR